ncbi:MAG: tripartite tricarboxylate transporter TctB family protein [Hyphomicrobiales bacterium]|nr:MAG: tripartite tricarboxylate transporter TctB family protein [Hyphomicrobiales bacterium]
MTELEKLAASTGDTSVSPVETLNEPDFSARPSRPLEIIIAVAALALSVLALVLSQSIYLRMGGGGLDPKWWPTVLSILAACLSAILVGMSLFGPVANRGDLEAGHRDGWVRMLIALALSALYVFAWWQVGYLIPTVVYLVALLWSFGLRSWKGLVAFPVVTTALIYGLFHYMLRVPL